MVDTSAEAVTKLLDGVTPGPWAFDPHFSTVVAGEKCIAEVFTSDADARFIATARDLVPAMLAERDALLRENENLRQIERNVQAVREHEYKRAEAALAEVERLKSQPVTVQDAAETDAERFDRADWFWRVMDPDDSADTPAEAIHRGMIGDYCVCEIASSYTGPVRFGFNAPVLDPESDDTEFSHFATQQEAIDAAKARSAALRAIAEGRE